MPPKKYPDLLFVDTETTGLDSTRHELIEVAAIRTSYDGLDVIETYEAKLPPVNLRTADPKALQMNGYTPEEWTPEKCEAPLMVVNRLAEMATDTMLVGHNVSFDESFLLPLFRHYAMTPPWSYHKIDTVSLAWLHYNDSTSLEGLSLNKVCAFLGVEQPTAHRAMADAETCRKVYLRLMQRTEVF